MKPDLVLFANSTEARLFARHPVRAHLDPLAELHEGHGHAKAGALGHDRPGHGSLDHGASGVAFAPRMDPKRKRHLAFAHELAERLEELLAAGTYERLAVFAGCPFRAELESQLGRRARASLSASVDLDLTGFGVHELEQRVDAHLPLQSSAS